MTSLPTHIQKRSIPRAGNGLFTTKAIDAGEEVLRVERPLVAVLNQGQLTTACEWCFIWVPEGGGTSTTKLRACQGCRIVRYCSKTCQTSSWQHHHRHECKIFSKLYPNVLPNTVRILLQLLLRRKSKSLPDTEWQSLLSLQSHLSDFRSSPTKITDGLTTHQTISLMSQAARTYSSSSEPLEFFHSLTATTLINALTLTTPHFDPLGLTLCPRIALLNHSCTPNTAITYSHSTLSLRSLHPIPANTELTISYIDTTQPTQTRQTELQSRYFFTCTCPACSTNSTNSIPDLPPSSSSDDLKARSVKAIELQNAAATAPSPQEAAPLLSQALNILAPLPPTQQPYAAILHTAFLNAIALGNLPLALTYKLHEYFSIDPVHYVPDFHPVRVVHKWVLLRLIIQIAGLVGEGEGEGDGLVGGGDGLVGEGDSSVERVREWGVEWGVVVWFLWREVEEGVGKSHGVGSFFAEEVRVFGRKIGMGREGGMAHPREAKEREWRKLRVIGEGVGVGGRRLLE